MCLIILFDIQHCGHECLWSTIFQFAYLHDISSQINDISSSSDGNFPLHKNGTNISGISEKHKDFSDEELVYWSAKASRENLNQTKKNTAIAREIYLALGEPIVAGQFNSQSF